MQRGKLGVSALILLGILVCSALGAGPGKLAKRHQDWLTGPASYLITRPERESFLALSTDEERDAFVERFWEVRNPSAGGAQNEFKEEFYRRVAYANAFFGREAGTEGWRTDRGRTYILFGRPQTSMNYLGNQELYPTELWFYANPGLPELPPFFYVLFYEKDGIGGYRFYHPYVDGPEKLMRARPARGQAYHYLRGISPELARASLTLIPGEPVDAETYTGSMASATILNAIQGYNETPGYVRVIQEKALRLERVTSRIRYEVAPSALLTFVVYEQGEPWLHWEMEVQDPRQTKTAQLEYEVTEKLHSNGRLVFERSETPTIAIPEKAQDEIVRRPFVYEDRMPVVPGRYRLQVALRNKVTGRSYELSKEITVEPRGGQIGLSDVLIVDRHEADARVRPFQFGGTKFYPAASPQLTASRGLRVLYQVTAPGARTAESGLAAEYVIGNVSSRFRKTFEDKLDLRQADAFGTLMVSKSLPIEDVAPGAYQLAVRIKDPATGKIAGRSVAFVVSADTQQPKPIVVSRANAGAPQWLAANQFERGLCWLAQGQVTEALAALETSWRMSKNPAVEGAIRHLREQAQKSSEFANQGGRRNKQ